MSKHISPIRPSRWSRTRKLSTAAVLAAGLVAAVPSLAGAAPSGAVTTAAGATVVGLQLGSTGDGVKLVQERLLGYGYTVTGGADGVFGAGTDRALKKFQEQNGLSVTGVVSTKTAEYLGITADANPTGAAAAPQGLAAPAPAPAAAPAPTATTSVVGLQRGSQGEHVKIVQQRLIGYGYTVSGGADGVFGSSTERALKTFQSQNGLSVTGVVSAKTAEYLGVTGAAPAAPAAPAPAGRVPGSIEGLQQGATGDDVKTLQNKLTAAGLVLRGGVDGRFGPSTEQAVKLVQRVNGLSETGVVDARTASALGGYGGNASAPTAPAPTGSPSIAAGARGDTVKQVQTLLIGAGVSVRGGADGIFGPATQQAVKTFQQSKGLSVTGVVDDATRAALTSAQGGAAPAPAAPAASPYVGLKQGSNGAAVTTLQQALMSTGLTVRGGADGVFGPGTRAALVSYQQINGLGATGVVDAATATMLGLGSATPAPSTGASSSGYAAYDERGSRVMALQTALIKAGIPVPGGVDGVFGSGTLGAVVSFQKARGLTANGKVNQATAEALGLTAATADPKPEVNPASVALQARPVAGSCWYGDTWQAARGGGRAHLGVDIGAKEGTPLRAVVSGKISQVYADKPGSLSGNALKIATSDGTYFFYAHLSSIEAGIAPGVPVQAGQVVGYVGKTGNASNTPHLHLEIHPGGGSAINPYPIVKQYGACG